MQKGRKSVKKKRPNRYTWVPVKQKRLKKKTTTTKKEVIALPAPPLVPVELLLGGGNVKEKTDTLMNGIKDSLARKDPIFWEYSKDLLFHKDRLAEVQKELETAKIEEEKENAEYKIKGYNRAISGIKFSIDKKLGVGRPIKSEKVLKKLEEIKRELECAKPNTKKFKKKIMEFDRLIDR